jgi:hypothetical protein
MIIRAICEEAWPQLTWHAEWKRGGDEIVVRHGKSVEIRNDRIFEGAWDGSFEVGDFHLSSALCGSGLIIQNDEVILIPPFHPQERIFTTSEPGNLLRQASNSLHCWLQMAGYTLDSKWPDYHIDLLKILRLGHVPFLPCLRLSNGKSLAIIELSPWAEGIKEGRRLPPRRGLPVGKDFECYRLGVKKTMEALIVNAASPKRKLPLATASGLSTGFDSVAISVLAAELGVNRAFTMLGREDARSIGADLGMHVISRDLEDCEGISEKVLQEFHLLPLGKNVPMALFEKEHGATLLFTGHGGDEIWSMKQSFAGANLSRPNDQILAGVSYAEYRLRLGLVVVPAALLGQWHWQDIGAISHSDEMLPFLDDDGGYSRPIARRIGMEAGVARDHFGKNKTIGEIIRDQSLLCAEGSSFNEFIKTEVPDYKYSAFDIEEFPKYHGAVIRWGIHWASKGHDQRYFSRTKGVISPSR